ncbi:MAG: flotillin [SAR116 cluster bacterium MED-G06]|nr:MAG: flotillin [SAR116 cluster bacterium MED-G06]RPG86514.1 MAG: flotillin [Candidatus Puniceispirillum sp. TMED245]RPG89145.1 MAG: flotillin [Candidatus Puniceispirillum sp. TMED245]|tara:strand:+ start:5707 stop:7341 length:1635 start_codon:yes stop_codon:yes gene_type:complete
MSATSIILLVIVLVAILIVVAAWLYERASRETSLVRTGLGGRKVVLDGGVIVLPYFHKVSRVNMQTMRLEVHRHGEQALITKDRLRVDVGVEFYVSVEPTEESIARASQTLGKRVFDADKLRELIEGKLVDTLRSVAAQLTMDELHEGRGAFVKEVKSSLTEEIRRNGLELESVSLTALDQTPFTALDENNAFNAVGMRKLAEVIADSKKERATIDADAEVSVRRSAMEAAKRTLQIDLEEQEAQIEQVKTLESLRASQLAEIAASKAESEIAANAAKIEMERSIRASDIRREEEISKAEIAQRLAVQTAEQQRNIALRKQSMDEAKAEAAASGARAEAVKAAEGVETAKAIAAAERGKSLDLISAEKESQVHGLRKQHAADTEADTMVKLAGARLKAAQSDADAEKVRLTAMAEEMALKAENARAMNEAENVMSPEIIDLSRDKARLEALPKIVEQMVRPAEKIDSIKIHHITGGALDRSGSGSGGGERSEKPPVNQALDSIMDMAVQLPALRKIGEDLGVSFEEGMSGVVDDSRKPPSDGGS